MSLAPITLAARGLTGEKDPSRLETGDLILASNVDFAGGNLAQKEGGSTKINAAALSGAPAIMKGHDWWPASATQRRVVATADGTLYKDDMTGAFATTLKSGLGATKLTQMIEGGAEDAGNDPKLFVVNGNDVVQVLAADGATTSNLASPPADWSGANQPSLMFPFRNVMLGAGNLNFPSQVYASLGSDHEDYVSAGTWTLNVYPGKGQRLVAGLLAFGRAWLWKYPVGIYWIEDSASAVSGWYAKEASNQYGAAPTPHAVAQIDEAIVAFLSQTGSLVLMQESSGALTGATFTDLTKALNLRDFMRNTFNLGRLNRAQMLWYDDKKQLHVALAALGSSVEDRRLVVDFNEERTRVEVTTKDVNEALWAELDTDRIPRPIAGDNAGFVRKLDQVARAVDGSAYTFAMQTAPTDFSDVNARFMGYKLFRALHLEYAPSGNFSVSVEVIVDGRSMGTVTFLMDTAGSTLPFVLPGVLSGDELRRRTRDIVGEGYYLSLKLTESGQNNPKLARAWAEFDLVGVSR